MVIVAWTLLMAGLMIASLAVAHGQESQNVAGLVANVYFLLGIGIIVASIVLRRWKGSRRGPEGSEEQSSLAAIQGKLQIILKELRAIGDGRESMVTREMTERIDTLLNNPVFEIVELRQAMIGQVGYGPYGMFMSDFATGERFISRSWSAGVDGYDDEAFEYVEKSLPFFESARDHLAAMS